MSALHTPATANTRAANLLSPIESLYIRAKIAVAARLSNDRGMTTLEVCVIAAALLLAALGVTKLITDAVTSHSSTIK